MNARFRRTLKIVAVVHVGVLLALAAGPRWTCRHTPPDTAINISFRMEAPATPSPPETVPDSVSEPIRNPVLPEPPPDTMPVQPEPRRKIEVSQKRVVREVETPPEPVFRNDMVRKLEKQLTQPVQRDTVEQDAVQLQRVRDTLYRSWESRPSTQEAAGATATVTLRFETGGRVIERSLTGASGNAALDASVMRAVQSVTWIPGLTDAFLEARHYRVSVAFRLE